MSELASERVEAEKSAAPGSGLAQLRARVLDVGAAEESHGCQTFNQNLLNPQGSFRRLRNGTNRGQFTKPAHIVEPDT